MEKVGFWYEQEGESILEEIDLQLTPGRRIAIIGASGVGKTSLINLMLGFEKSQTGKLTVGGIEAHDLDPEMVRTLFAVLPQAVYLFDDTLRGNLLLAKPDATDEELTSALDRVDLTGWFSALPDGLDTWVGEHGLRMSGGEKQRLGIARVQLQDKPLILMDEPTVNLDRSTARKVMNNFFSHSSQKGVLLVTHDLDLLPQMDEIIVLSGSRIVQRGTLETLKMSQDEFRNLFDWEVNRLSEE